MASAKRYLALAVLAVFSASTAFALSYEAEEFASSYRRPASEGVFQSSAVQRMRWSENEAQSEIIKIKVNTSQVLRFDRDVIRVSISNPDICDVAMVSQKDVLVNAKKQGTVNLIVWDEENRISSYVLQSTLDIERLEKVLRSIDPTATINILPLNNSAAIYGAVETNQKLKQITDAAKAFDATTLVFLKLRDSKQILLEVRFAEVDRRYTKDFKFDFFALVDKWMLGSFTGLTGGSIASNTSSSAASFAPEGAVVGTEVFPLATETVGNLNLNYFSGSLGLQNFLKWLESKNVLKVIARPNLLAKDGEPAEFKVGGEYPIPTTTNTSGQVSITYKEYGTIMKFTPDVLDSGVIRLKIETEVSELDFSVAVSSGGVSVPGLTKRSESTVTELKDNQTLVIGGFISQRLNRIHRKTPKLGDAPIIGKLFTAEEYSVSDVELIITLTPHLVKPLELEEKKELYKAEEVKEAVEIYVPPYPDPHGDKIHSMMTQGEKYRNFDQELSAKKFADSIASRFPEPPVKADPFKKASTPAASAKPEAKKWWEEPKKAETKAPSASNFTPIAPSEVYDYRLFSVWAENCNDVDLNCHTKLFRTPDEIRVKGNAAASVTMMRTPFVACSMEGSQFPPTQYQTFFCMKRMDYYDSRGDRHLDWMGPYGYGYDNAEDHDWNSRGPYLLQEMYNAAIYEADYAKEEGIVIYAVGLGTKAPEPPPLAVCPGDPPGGVTPPRKVGDPCPSGPPQDYCPGFGYVQAGTPCPEWCPSYGMWVAPTFNCPAGVACPGGTIAPDAASCPPNKCPNAGCGFIPMSAPGPCPVKCPKNHQCYEPGPVYDANCKYVCWGSGERVDDLDDCPVNCNGQWIPRAEAEDCEDTGGGG